MPEKKKKVKEEASVNEKDSKQIEEAGKAPASDIMVKADGLVKIYKTKETEVLALQGLDLEVQAGELTLDKPIYLIAGPQSNSLAACCEILSWINLHGGKGEIKLMD